MKENIHLLIVYLGFMSSFILFCIPILQFMCLVTTICYTLLQSVYLLIKIKNKNYE